MQKCWLWRLLKYTCLCGAISFQTCFTLLSHVCNHLGSCNSMMLQAQTFVGPSMHVQSCRGPHAGIYQKAYSAERTILGSSDPIAKKFKKIWQQIPRCIRPWVLLWDMLSDQCHNDRYRPVMQACWLHSAPTRTYKNYFDKFLMAHAQFATSGQFIRLDWYINYHKVAITLCKVLKLVMADQQLCGSKVHWMVSSIL